MPKLLNLWAGVKFGGKLGRQILGIFRHEKSIVLMMCLLLWECQVTQKFTFFELQMTLGSSFIFVKDRAQKEGFHHHFWGKNLKKLFFPTFLNTLW